MFSNYSKKGVVIILLSAIGLIFGLFYDEFLKLIHVMSTKVGFSTHLIDALSTNSIMQDKNREFLIENFIRSIKESPFGYGVMGDRYLSKSIYGIKPMYPHNIFLEIMVNFGYVIGGLLCIVLVFTIVKWLMSKEQKKKKYIIVFVAASFVKLLVSGSYWNDQMFFMMLGFLFALRTEKNVRIHRKSYMED